MSVQYVTPASPDTGLARLLDGIPRGPLTAGKWGAPSDGADHAGDQPGYRAGHPDRRRCFRRRGTAVERQQ
jgi:hypothetical protein